jgi:hypothetical protein
VVDKRAWAPDRRAANLRCRHLGEPPCHVWLPRLTKFSSIYTAIGGQGLVEGVIRGKFIKEFNDSRRGMSPDKFYEKEVVPQD